MLALTLRHACEGLEGFVLFWFFSPSNAVEFISGISLLHGDVDTLIRFSPYLLVLKELTSFCWGSASLTRALHCES